MNLQAKEVPIHLLKLTDQQKRIKEPMLQFATQLRVLIENHDVLTKNQYKCQYSVECCSCRKSTEWGDGLEAGASVGVGFGCSEQRRRKLDGETIGVDLQ